MSLDQNALESIARSFNVNDGFYISQGKRTGQAVYRKFGRIDEIQTVTPADCWEFGITVGAEKYTFSTSAAIDSISSSNAGDSVIVTVIGLDANLLEVSQDVTLNGQNRVALSTPLLRVNRAFNANGADFLGNVYIYEDTPITLGVPNDVTKVRGYISIKGQQTLQAVYTVPADKTAYLMRAKTAIAGRKIGFATYEVFVRFPGGVFRIQETHDLASEANSAIIDDFKAVPIAIPGGTDIVPQITVSANDIGASVTYDFILVDN